MTQERKFGLFLLLWCVQSIITACFTELYSDEAYYWMYSRFPDWGYFDHPPGVAIVIWLGSWLGKTEIAVRIITILLMTTTLWLIYRLVKPRHIVPFCLTLFSFLSFHLMGFVSLPDTPFFFFSIVFMIAYRKFLEQESLAHQVLLGVAAALMLYSKYHGVLVILFVVLSNPRLLLNYRFYVAGLYGILLFLPHLWWQFSHNFPSLQYHLVDRAASQYKISQTLDYTFGNLPYHGGLISVALFITALYYKPRDRWEKALKWNLYGTYLFFFFITFRGQYIEPNWTVFATFPMVYLGYRQVENVRWFNTYKVGAGVFAAILLLLKVHLMFPLVDIPKDRVWDFHLSKQFARQVEGIVQNNMIVANDYQTASLLNFYTHKDYYIPSLNINGRANQYSIWALDAIVCDADIAYVNNHLEGPLAEGRMHKTQHVTLLNDVTSLKSIQLHNTSLTVSDSVISLGIEAAYRYPQPCRFTDTLWLEFRLYGEGSVIATEKLPFANLVDGNLSLEAYTYHIPKTPSQQVSRVSVRILSDKLGGGNNDYLMIGME